MEYLIKSCVIEIDRRINGFIAKLEEEDGINQVSKWFNKNYKKLYPTTEYTTKYGRKIKLI